MSYRPLSALRLPAALTAAVLSGLLLAAVALAQTADDRAEAQAAEPTTSAATPNTEETAGADGGVVLSPFDYEASESISEDASVSFPVDI